MNINALCDVITERFRQVTEEKWSDEHDDQYVSGELCKAAAGYADHAADVIANGGDANFDAPCDWPWDDRWWKPKDPRRDLVRAAALILAEIGRLDRLSS